MATSNDSSKPPFRMEVQGEYKPTWYLNAARIEDGLSVLTETVLEFSCNDREIDLEALLGKTLSVIDAREATTRVFPGTCVSAQYLGILEGTARYRAVLRPWLWYLSRARNCRVFQDLTAVEIIEQVLRDINGFSDFRKNLSGKHPARVYTIQYRETDLDFICRLMEEEGISFFFDTASGQEILTLVDSHSAHKDVAGDTMVPFRNQSAGVQTHVGHVFDWSTGRTGQTYEFTLEDYDFEIPTAQLGVKSLSPHKGKDGLKSKEAFDYPGRYKTTGVGNDHAKIRMQSEMVGRHIARGGATRKNLSVGALFTLQEHVRTTENRKWNVIRATYLLRDRDTDMPPPPAHGHRGQDEAQALGAGQRYVVMFDAIPHDVQFRAPLVTPWPEIAGVQTAVVVGKKGEDIWTDKHGRIKVQFHWDRLGKTDENSSCWVRCMMPWTGKGWGMMAVPRIGQEVVVQFEEGNPDRPLVIGMLYNADHMPPWALPANQTQSGVKTRSSKEGSAALFNELRFEDKKGEEEIYFHAERDYTQIVENNAKISVGESHKDKGDMDLTVHRNLTEEVKTGDHRFTVASGNQTVKIKKDMTETIEGKQTETITKDVTRTVTMGNVKDTLNKGNYEQKLDMGNHDTKLAMGNHSTKLSLGDVSVKADLGKITMEAMQSIELKVGGSSIKIDQMGVTIKGAMSFKAEGGMTADLKSGMATTVASDLQTEVKGTMTNVKGTGMVMIKGSITMIN